MSKPRYAIYWAPEAQHPLWHAGREWLGRDPARPGAMVAMREARAEPRRYGFHATLKAPMFLREDADASSFLTAVGDVAAGIPRFEMPLLAVNWLGDFLALRPLDAPAPSHPLRRLADACVRELDPWRAKPSERALQQRLTTGDLDAEQRELLRRWGYPHVFERWRFHMTLSDSLPADDTALRMRLRHQAVEHFAVPLTEALECASLCVFIQAGPSSDFMLAQRFALGA